LAHALPAPLRATSAAQATALLEQRRLCGRRDTKRSDWRGVRADAITSGVCCLRQSKRPGFGRGGWPGGRSGGWDGTWAQRRERTERQFVQRDRSRAAGRKPDRDPWARVKAAAPMLPVNTGHAPPSPVPAHRAL